MIQDLSGQRFGMLVVNGRAGSSKDGSRLWRCTCDCGREVVVTTRELTSSHKSQCALWDHSILGARFGRLVVVDYSESDERGHAKMFCKCDCGNEIVVRAHALRDGRTRSCGCLNNEKRIENSEAYLQKVVTGDGTRLDALDRKIRSDNTSGIKGVYYNKKHHKWVARIMLRGQRKHLGSFDNLADAAEARREAEQELFDPVLEAHGLEPTSEKTYEDGLRNALEREK